MAPFRKLRQAIGLRRDRLSPHVRLGRHTYGLQHDTVLRASADSPVVIGSFCSIAEGVRIHGATHHALNRVTTFPMMHVLRGEAEPGTSRGGVTIGHDVWIGSRATILSGAKIGNGAVIGAEAVVGGTVTPYAIVVGNPGRTIRHRFDAEIIMALQRIAWWDWPDAKIMAEIDAMYGSVEDFVARHDRLEAGSP